MIAVVWNTGDRRAAWEYLVDELRPDQALLQEFTPRPEDSQRGQIVRAAAPGRSWGSAVYVKEGTAHSEDLAPMLYPRLAKPFALSSTPR